MFKYIINQLNKEKKLLHHIDSHSHLLPQLDDGVKSMTESLHILKQLEKKSPVR